MYASVHSCSSIFEEDLEALRNIKANRALKSKQSLYLTCLQQATTTD